jgi:hypothetical protein
VDGKRPHDEPGDDDSESDASNLSSIIAPSHLHQLFENRLIGSTGHDSPAPSPHPFSINNSKRSHALRRLMPIRDDMLKIACKATSWLSLYKTLFPVSFLLKDGDEMLSQYDKLQQGNPNTVETATFLLSVAITVQQAPEDTAGQAGGNLEDVSAFIEDVADSVDRFLISDNELVGTIEGIETALLFVRL